MISSAPSLWLCIGIAILFFILFLISKVAKRAEKEYENKIDIIEGQIDVIRLLDSTIRKLEWHLEGKRKLTVQEWGQIIKRVKKLKHLVNK